MVRVVLGCRGFRVLLSPVCGKPSVEENVAMDREREGCGVRQHKMVQG